MIITYLAVYIKDVLGVSIEDPKVTEDDILNQEEPETFPMGDQKFLVISQLISWFGLKEGEQIEDVEKNH